MNTHLPLVENKIKKHLEEAVRFMKFLDCDQDLIEDLEQTKHIILTEFDNERRNEYENNID